MAQYPVPPFLSELLHARSPSGYESEAQAVFDFTGRSPISELSSGEHSFDGKVVLEHRAIRIHTFRPKKRRDGEGLADGEPLVRVQRVGAEVGVLGVA